MARRRRRPARATTPAGSPVLPPQGSGVGAPGVGIPPGAGAETTGRFLVVYKEAALDTPKRASQLLMKVAGIKKVVSAADFKDHVVKPAQASSADAVYFPALGIAVVDADDEQLQALLDEAADPASNILAVEPEYVFHAIQMPPDPLVQYLRGYRDAVDHLYHELTTGRWGTGADAAQTFQDTAQFTWGLQATLVSTSKFSGQGVKLAVLDTGVDLQHPDFKGRAFTSQSFISGQTVQDGQGHGTHTMGTAGGPQRPASGVRRFGCAYAASLYAGKVLNNSGSSVGSSVLNGMNWAVTNKIAVISMSLGADVDQVSQAFETAGRRALQAGCLMIAAAGNNANRAAGNFGFVGQPANSPSIMAVAALDSQLRIADFSSRSSAQTGTGGKVDIAAPGVNVYSSVPVNRGTHAIFSGTSMATPHVAGIAALWSQNTKQTGMALWTTITQNARRIAGDVRDVGSGLVQAPQ
jgi:subtilisin